MERPWSETSAFVSAYRSALVGVAAGSSLIIAFSILAQNSVLQAVTRQPLTIALSSLSQNYLMKGVRADFVGSMQSSLAQDAWVLTKIDTERMTQQLNAWGGTSGTQFSRKPPSQPKRPTQTSATHQSKVGTPKLSKEIRIDLGQAKQAPSVTAAAHTMDEVTAEEIIIWSQKRNTRVILDREVQEDLSQSEWLQTHSQVFRLDSAITGHRFSSAHFFLGNPVEDDVLGAPQWFISQAHIAEPVLMSTVEVTVSAPIRTRGSEAVLTQAQSQKVQAEAIPMHQAPSTAPRPGKRIARVETATVVDPQKAPSSSVAAVWAHASRTARSVAREENLEGTLRMSIQNLNTQEHRSILEGTVSRKVSTTIWSYEGWSHRSKEGWIVTASADHWPTLSWFRSGNQRLPKLVSHREASVLAALSGTALQPSAGLVVGDIPAGYRIEFSGRAEEAVYWTPELGQLSSHDYSKARSFALVNAEPGIHLVHLVHAWTGERVPVAAAIVGGYSTYVDLSLVRRVELKGRVAESSARRYEAVAGMKLGRVGDSDSFALSGKDGFFKFPQMLVAGQLPVYIEFSSKTFPFPHRMKISLATSDIIDVGDLFAISPNRVNHWMSQLEGGVSPESGLLLSAWRHQNTRLDDARVQPIVFPLSSSVDLEPETYFVGHEDSLNVDGSLGKGVTTTLTTQLVPGLHKVEVKLPGRADELWSEVAVASPGVVTLLRSGYRDE